MGRKDERVVRQLQQLLEEAVVLSLGVPVLEIRPSGATDWINNQCLAATPFRDEVFVRFFLWESLRGPVDVALRTLTPKMRIQASFSEFRTRLQRPGAHVLLVYCMSLLPGTLLAAGVGLFLTVGPATTVDGLAFLEYPRAWSGVLILLIESAATLAIATTLALAYIGRRPECLESASSRSAPDQRERG